MKSGLKTYFPFLKDGLTSITHFSNFFFLVIKRRQSELSIVWLWADGNQTGLLFPCSFIDQQVGGLLSKLFGFLGTRYLDLLILKHI